MTGRKAAETVFQGYWAATRPFIPYVPLCSFRLRQPLTQRRLRVAEDVRFLEGRETASHVVVRVELGPVLVLWEQCLLAAGEQGSRSGCQQQSCKSGAARVRWHGVGSICAAEASHGSRSTASWSVTVRPLWPSTNTTLTVHCVCVAPRAMVIGTSTV